MADTSEKGFSDHAHPVVQKRAQPSLLIKLAWRVEDAFEGINWKHVTYKICAFSYLAFMMWMTWLVLPLKGHWPIIFKQSDKVPVSYQELNNYFGRFEGFATCGVRARDLYKLPTRDEFCPNRKTLLQALSDGGRVGYDAPYQPKDCGYRWYSVDEICFILERFDGLVFVGDASLQSVYNGLNILLRQDLAAGSLKSWEMDDETRGQCRCNAQFTNPACAEHFVTDSEDVTDNTPSIGSGYFCKRTPHAMLRIDGSPAPADGVSKFKALVPEASRSRYQPIPIIHSLSPAIVSSDTANRSMAEFVSYADESLRRTPLLWIGPTAPGHSDDQNRKGVAETWKYDYDMAKAAQQNDIDVLKMYNMTAQANTHDGVSFGEKVAITQAMMVINWLSRLESS